MHLDCLPCVSLRPCPPYINCLRPQTNVCVFSPYSSNSPVTSRPAASPSLSFKFGELTLSLRLIFVCLTHTYAKNCLLFKLNSQNSQSTNRLFLNKNEEVAQIKFKTSKDPTKIPKVFKEIIG